MKQISFATGNDRKLGEARAACKDFGIEVTKVELDIDEIQSHDPIKISKRKAEDAYSQLQKPVVITDSSWSIPALNGFPGGYMKEVIGWFSPQDFINLLADKTDRAVSFTETIIYKDADVTKIFSKQYFGEMSMEPKGNGNSIEQVAMFGGQTIAELHDVGLFTQHPKDYVWYDFAKWYVNEFSK